MAAYKAKSYHQKLDQKFLKITFTSEEKPVMNHSHLDCDNLTDLSHTCLGPALSNMHSQQSLNIPWEQLKLF